MMFAIVLCFGNRMILNCIGFYLSSYLDKKKHPTGCFFNMIFVFIKPSPIPAQGR